MKHLTQSNKNDSALVHQGLEYVLDPAPEGMSEKNLWDYFRILKRRKWFFIMPLLIIMPAIIISSFRQGFLYEATATVHIETINPNILSIKQVLTPESPPEFYNTQYEIIKSRAMAEQVVDKLLLYEKPPLRTVRRDAVSNALKHIRSQVANTAARIQKAVFNIGATIEQKSVLPPLAPHEDMVTKRRLNAISQLQNDLKVMPRKGTQLVDITLTGRDPREVTQQVNMVAETYVSQNLKQKQEASKRAIIWLKKEAKNLKEKIETSGTSTHMITTLENKNTLSLNWLQEQRTLLLQKIETLQDKHIEIVDERKISESRIDAFKNIYKNGEKIIDEANYFIIDDPIINSLRERYIALKSQISLMSEKYKSKHKKIISLNNELSLIHNDINFLIDKKIKSQLIRHRMVIDKETSLKEDLDKHQKKLDNLKKIMSKYGDHQRELQIDKELYHSIATKIAENQIAQALDTNNVKVLERAGIPSKPEFMGMLTRLVLGILVSLGLGVGVALIMDSTDKRFTSTDEAELQLGIPFLGFIPFYRFNKEDNLITLYDPLSGAAKAYRSLRTWLQSANQQPGSTLLITSASPSEGKSTTAANLAVSFAQLGRMVLIIDADLRRPSLAKMFTLHDKHGLTDILARGRAWKETVHSTRLENLKCLPTGSVPHNPTELLSSNAMTLLLEELQSTFDIIVVDAPITLSIPDVTILAPMMQEILLVHHPKRCEKDAVIEAKRILEKAGGNLIGVVFNFVGPKEQRYYYSAERYHQNYQYYSHTSASPGYANQCETSFVDMRPTGALGTWVATSIEKRNDFSHGEEPT